MKQLKWICICINASINKYTYYYIKYNHVIYHKLQLDDLTKFSQKVQSQSLYASLLN